MGSLWNRSGIIERYGDDLPAAGAKAFFYPGGSATALTVYRDSGGSSAHPNPVVADANGRWPDVFVPYIVSFDVQVKSAFDVQLTFSQQIPNPDPVELTVTIPAEERVATGMIHAEMVNTVKAGYVRLNGRTIGNAASEGSERNNADTVNLFTYLYNNLNDTIAPVSGGRTSVAADYAANKTITLPNWQGAMPIGLDDMGAAAGSFFTGLTFTAGDATTAGARTGANGVTLVIANLPAHSHSGTTGTEGEHTHTGTTGVESQSHTHSATTGGGSSHNHGNGTLNANFQALTGGQQGQFPAVGAAAVSVVGGGGVSVFSSGSFGLADSTNVDVLGSTASENSHTHFFTSGNASQTHTHSFTTAAGTLHSHTFTTDSIGSGTIVNNLARSVLVTWFIKL